MNAKSGEEDLDTGTGETGDVEARCFRTSAYPPYRPETNAEFEAERDSPKSHVLVLLFIIITGGLLIGAVLKQNGIDVKSIVYSRLNKGRWR